MVVVSAVTVAEISIKRSLGKLEAPEGVIAAVEDGGFDWLSLEPRHAAALADLPWHHRDPFDRLLVAQASTDGLTLLTADPRIREYDVDVQ